MFGGQSHPDFDIDMGIYVDMTRQEIYKELEESSDKFRFCHFIFPPISLR